ncbi:PAS domain-containing protein [Brevundimonas sp. NIBR11]|uniref:PAS domain-containing protein n=1 Tax=Brevundimonas sp. NIBR11 TaxID=3015999 RepID=UPI0022EFDBE2|nr:PAS domain-containing protein [Brevundimonas sp. NIBR11]WGM30251.1 Sensor histidine kinase RcsC [Brevundimonas sp. NIBR11]
MTASNAIVKDTAEGGDQAAFDRLVKLACTIFDTPIIMLSVLDGERAIFRSNVPITMGWMPREKSVSHVVAALGQNGVLVIEDATAVAPFNEHPLVTGPDGIRFYAGAAVSTADGRVVGAFSVLDVKPRARPSDSMLDKLTLMAGMAGDILDQSAATRVIAEQLGVLSMAEQMSGVGHWRLELATNKVAWSDEVYRIHGVRRDTFDPGYDDAVEFYHPEDRAEVRGCIQRTIETGAPYEFRLRIIRGDGEARIVVSRGMAETDADGHVSALYGVFQDVTEAETARRRIVDSEARYRMLADGATDIIITYGVDGIVTYVSPSIEASSGKTPGEVIGRPVTDMILPEDVPQLAESFRALVKLPIGQSSRGVRYRGVHRDGSVRWFETRTSVIRNAEGQAVGFHDVVRDITETKRLEAELIAARDVAEAAARVKSEFLANMSHELRTPLTAVIGFSGLLQESVDLPETERRYADRIATASEALLSVINDILDYSKLEAEAVGLDEAAFDPEAMAKGAAAIVETQCLAKGIGLAVAVSDDLPRALLGDEGRLRQVTLNFLSNAVKFTVSGNIRMEVGRVGDRMRVAVSDSGIGVAPEKIDGLFERFTQADASTTRVYGGTGLGLAISRRLIELMGGDIGAASRPGEGSTFWFEVPLREAEHAEAAEADDVVGLAPGTRILLADDAPANRELVRIVLAGWGVELRAVCEGAEAVQAAATEDFDLILMDVHMPVMDGMDATRAIRALEGPRAGVPILALTANVQPEQIAACAEAGMDGHVGKPIQIGELIAAIAGALKSVKDGRAARAA